MSRYIDANKIQYHTNNYCQEVVTKEDIDKLPTENVIPVKHSHWVEQKTGIKPKQGIKYPVVGCPNCRTVFCDLINVHKVIYRYCPYCMAKMDEE